jgi:fimbrial chaperone protein
MKKILLLIIVTLKGFSLSISPINLELDLKKGQGYYTLSNDANSKKVIAVSLKSRTLDLDGKNILEPTKDFIVYPKQVVLKPKEKRLIRLIWKSKEKLSVEKCYKIFFEEVGVEFDFKEEELEKGQQRAGLAFGIKFEGCVYVKLNQGVKPKVVVTEFNKKRIEGEDFVVISVENVGDTYTQISTKDLELELLYKNAGKKEQWRLVSEELLEKTVGKAFVILAKGKREIKLPCKENQIPDDVLGVRIVE